MLFGCLVDRNHHYLYRGEGRRQHESVVVAVRHYESTHKTGGYAPGSGPHIVLFAVLSGELHVEGLGEVLAEEV